MRLLPKMGGVISIWLTSTLLAMKYLTPLNLAIALLSLLSVNPLMYMKKDFSLVFPILLSALAAYILYLNPTTIYFLLAYSILFIALKFVNEWRIETKIGAFALTFPFPMMALAYGAGLMEILAPLTLLFSLTAFNLFLADSRIYGRVSAKNYLAIIPLALIFYILSHPVLAAAVTAAAIVVTVKANSISVRSFGFSLLFLNLLFVVGFLALDFAGLL
ncbi:hypothetical protein [Archaeoglobus fulgidus]|jgi:hypothetical protein|uniref:Uncharacterized protein AF_0172 n=2 Tax=Archaeoglobus fulgidus TaxID=2234 RepID=Y172_ARCFU|nr:hypothetical protein [Archaeoglobus fulgidus]O30065.1 RecName: Full=Uncharacterized protein AF_0172 [Archaeoglobus fulgidus DSM 4304]AAB91063.1 predicted coding region AF_0172 [Archaeoglobus fulgidus DSM 4304]KUJ93408.1 MAG: hypothetical protein XD40_1388 [Archaeoglobus fulgidus]KUK06474.1 MAG: Uncharacterized protein XD48_1293 [Archaeoglobus fulgidus]